MALWFSRVWAFTEHAHEHVLPNIDRRTIPAADSLAPVKRAAAAKLTSQIPGLRIEHDSLRQSPKHILSTTGFLTGPSGEGVTVTAAVAGTVPVTEQHRAVKTFLAAHAPMFGHGPEVLDKARIKRDFVARRSGLRTVVWEQRLDDIPIYEGVMVGHTTARGELAGLSSQFIADPERAADAGTPNRAALQANPTISVEQAVLFAAEAVEEQPELRTILPADARPVGNERRQRFKAGALPGEADARLTWLPLDASSLRLCWEIELTRRLRGERYRVLIDARTGDVVLRQRLTVYLMPATYNVFTSDSPSPFSPGWQVPDTNQPPRIARRPVTLSALNPNASPLGWIADGENETRGNNVQAHTDRNGDDLPDLPRPQGSPFRVFNPPLNLDAEPAGQGDAAVVQMFYWCNWMHDRLYELGFDEASGNYQKDNFGRGGLGNDAVIADAQDGSGFNNANFTPSPDGVPGRIQMFLWSAPTPDADGDFDAEVVLHEYTHGLSDRLVGGGTGLGALQSAGMGEGWSDFYALALLSEPGDDIDAAYAYGGYVTHLLAGLRENYYFGIRSYPYSTDLSKNPLTFKDIDPAQISEHPGVPRSPLFPFSPLNANEVHAQGEVWCAMLWEARANLIRKHGYAAGNELILQLVTDGMKLSPPNPTFTQARDAILLADQINNAGANYGELWAGFAKRGLGFSAVTTSANTTSGIIEAFDLPDALYLLNPRPFVASGPVGGPLLPLCEDYPLTNISTQPITWSARSSWALVNFEPAAGTLAPGETVNVRVCLSAETLTLPRAVWSRFLIFSNHTSGVAQTRPLSIRLLEFAPMPFREDFESGALASFWTATGTGEFQTQVNPLNVPHGGSRHVTLDSSGRGKARNELTLALDLGGYTNVVLRFWAKSFGDEPDGPPPRPFQLGADFDGVAVSADGVDWFEVQSLRRLTEKYEEFTVDLDAALAANGLRYTPTFQIRFNQVDDFQIPFDGIALDDISVSGTPATRLSISAPAFAREGDGLLTQSGVVMLGVPVTQPLVVTLSSSEPAKVSLPRTVTIPAGTNAAAFSIRVLDDKLLDGTVAVTLRAEAAGHFAAQTVMSVSDDEKAWLRVILPPRIREGAKRARQGTVQVQPKPKRDVTVQLTASDPGELLVPASVVIRAGMNSAQFDLVAVDDERIDGPQRVRVTAHVENWIDGSDSIVVMDNDAPALSLILPEALAEGEGVLTNAGVVRLSGTLRTNLVVRLSSSDTTELGVPPTAEVRAGEREARFDLRLEDDQIIDGAQVVRVVATAAGFAAATATVNVLDDETPPRPALPSPADGATNVPVTLTLRWSGGLGEILVNGGFETGDFTGWQTSDSGYGAWSINDGSLNPDGPEETNAPHSGKFDAAIAQIGGGTHLLYQDITIPADALGATLTWSDRIRNHTPYFTPNQRFRVEVRDTNDTVLELAFMTQPGDLLLADWTTRTHSLDRFRGRTVRIAFYQEDSTGYFNTYLDDVSVRLKEPATSTTFDVYLGTVSNPGPAELRGSTTNAAWVLSLPALNTTYFWQVVARRGDAVVAGPVWSFVTRDVGAVHHFDWAPVASPQFVDQRFAVAVTARDDLGNVVRSFDGSVNVSARPAGGNGSTVVITELDTGVGDRVEFQNVSGLPVDLSGWQMSVYDGVSWPAPVATVTIPAGTLCPPGGIFSLSDTNPAPGQFPNFYTGTNVIWTFAPLNNPIVALLRDAAGEVVDIVCAGTADPAQITAPRTIPPGEWTGLPVFAVVSNPNFSLYRVGGADANDASDWTSGPPSFGDANPQMNLPFALPSAAAISPVVLSNFVTGVWSGFLMVREPAARMTLLAEDGAGHAGRANAIAVAARDDLGVSVTDLPDVVLIGDVLNYRLVVTNHGPSRATGVTLTNVLPEGVSFVSSATFNGACSNSGQTVFCQLDNLSAGDSARITLTTRALAMGLWTNTVFAARAEAETWTANNSATAVTTITGPWITVTNIGVTEGSGSAPTRMRMPVRLSAACTLPVSVAFATSNSTAVAPEDFTATNGVLVFAPGVTNLTLEIPVVADRVDEGLEIFFLNLASPTNGVIAVGQARCRITDDDPTPVLSVGDVTVREGAAGAAGQAEFVLRLSGVSGIEVGATFSTRDGTATAPADYQSVFGRLKFAPGETNQIIRVPITGDDRFEPRESFELRFSELVGLNFNDSPPRAFIEDDDDRVLDHFTWSEVPSPQFAGVPFAVSLGARDGLDRPASDFNGRVAISGVANRRIAVAGLGTNAWEHPLGTLYHDSRAQVLYLPENLGGAGLINGLTLSVIVPPGQALGRWTIRLQHAAATNFTRAAWTTSGWTTVHQSEAVVAGAGAATFLFDTPFAYDGTNALLVDFSFNNSSYTENGLVRSTFTPQFRSMVFQTDSAFGDPLSWSGGSAPAPLLVARIPNVSFLFETPVAVAPGPEVELVNGVWSGSVTVAEPWAGLFLRANDGRGRVADGNTFVVDSSADMDRDGLPDAWERRFLGGTEGRPQEDADGDGADNLAEFRAGTNPADATSLTVIQSVRLQALDVVVRFSSTAGRAYRLERSATLGAATWTPVVDRLPGNGRVMEVIDRNAAAGGPAFYRLVLRP